MSLSYDFEKSVILGLIAITIALIVGLIILISQAYGQENENSTPLSPLNDTELQNAVNNTCAQYPELCNDMLKELSKLK